MPTPTQDEFVAYLASLAPEGETLLVVQQKAVVRGRQPVLHGDGSPKYVWMPHLPEEYRAPGLAWYANTGSFISARMQEGLSASKNNCTHVLCMMLDDIGTKAKTPPLKPTWIIETSKGSYQYGFTFSTQPTKEEYVAAITAIAAAGYTDPGATNAVRNFRVPGSINLKEGRDKFSSRIVEFNPDREFTLEEICEALGVTPVRSCEGDYQPVRLRDSGEDLVLKWLNDQGLVLSSINDAGWVSIVCPNHAQHTDGTVSAKYHPIDHGFCCYHGHCEALGTKEFLAWVAEHGGPEVQHGVRSDVIRENMSSALEKARKPDVLFGQDAEKVREKSVMLDDLADERDQWFVRYAYNKVDDAYFDTETCSHISRKVFDALHRHHYCTSAHTNKKTSASNWYDERREERGGQVINQYIFAAGEGPLVNYEGALYGNLWTDARPKIADTHAGPIDLWLDHAKVIIPDEQAREHIFNMMAFKLQHPEEKINHAVLHTSIVEGTGKDTFWAPFFWSVCGHSKRNFSLVENASIGGNFSYELESEIIVLNELKESEAADRRTLANKLKKIVADPPVVLIVNKKGLHPYNAKNRSFVMAFSNEPIPLTISSSDRRWFCIETVSSRLDEKAARRIWTWYQNGGFEAVAHWLRHRDVSAFNPKASPIETEYKRSIIDGGMNLAESYILDAILERKGEFSTGAVGAPFQKLCSALSVLMPNGTRVVPAAVLHALSEAKWINQGMIASSKYPTKKQVWCAPEMANMSKSELRNLVGDAQSNLKIHKIGA